MLFGVQYGLDKLSLHELPLSGTCPLNVNALEDATTPMPNIVCSTRTDTRKLAPRKPNIEVYTICI